MPGGLSFKRGTDDTQEAPSHVIIEELLAEGADVAAYDPEAIETSRERFGDRIDYGGGMYEVLEGAEALLICTEWHEFRWPNFGRVQELLANPLVLDGRNLYEPERMVEIEFEYRSIGRPSYAPESDQATIEEAIVENSDR